MYDWYANDNIFTELTSFIPIHLIHKFNKLRCGHAQNPKKEVGSVGWDQWAHYMQAMHFDETNTIVEHFKMLYPCAQCGNMDADAEYHGGDLSMVCGCGIGEQDTSASKGSDRQITNLVEVHHSIMAYMDIRTSKGRPGAAKMVSSVRELLMRTTGHTHTWMARNCETRVY